MRSLLIAALVMTSTNTMAQMPPLEYVKASPGMNIEQIKAMEPNIRFHAARYPGAYAVCDRIFKKRFGEKYPLDPWRMLTKGRFLYGCEIENVDGPRVVDIVYSYDWFDPGMACNTIIHELGHFYGWPNTHPNPQKSSEVCKRWYD